jgi:hypothetical protein
MQYVQRFRWLIAGTMLATGMLVIVQFISCTAKSNRALSAKLQRIPVRDQSQTYPAEIQAPRGVTCVRPTKTGAIPAFSNQELSIFVLNHPVPLIEQLEPRMKITTVDCTYTAKRLAVVLPNKELGLPDDTPLCYVELQGKFSVRTPPSKEVRRLKPLIFSKSFEVFDARTGNLMLSGAFAR